MYQLCVGYHHNQPRQEMNLSEFEREELWKAICSSGSFSTRMSMVMDCNLVSMVLLKPWGFGEHYNVWRSYKLEIEVMNEFADQSKIIEACKTGLESKHVNITFIKKWN